jgi:tetraacyldisaccharide 4'-kinase
VRFILWPLSVVYRLVVGIRNFMFDRGWLRSFQFDFPVILVGNINTGGTGKTPHVIAIASILQQHYRIALLSRGYKRKTRGYIVATPSSKVEDIGDEPRLMKSELPAAEVAVCENRLEGISQLLLEEPPPGVIIMDDGFQHRSVKPGFSVILTAYNNLYINDRLLPAGRLREPKGSVRRADVVIISKCSPEMPKREASELRTTLHLMPLQHLFFTCYKYGELKPLFNDQPVKDPAKQSGCVLVSALASNDYLLDHLKREYKKTEVISFRDHHFYTGKDLERILSEKGKTSLLVTTRKDAVKLNELKQNIMDLGLSFFILDVEVEFLFNGRKKFEEVVRRYVKDARSIV